MSGIITFQFQRQRTLKASTAEQGIVTREYSTTYPPICLQNSILVYMLI